MGEVILFEPLTTPIRFSERCWNDGRGCLQSGMVVVDSVHISRSFSSAQGFMDVIEGVDEFIQSVGGGLGADVA